MDKQKHLIIGRGKVGRALYSVLSEHHNVRTIDKRKTKIKGSFEVVHICFPYSKIFNREVIRYNRLFNPDIIIIHSTVAVGTTLSLIEETKKENIVHSPVIGNEKHLRRSLETFTKFIGTHSPKIFSLAREALSPIKCQWMPDSRITELGKLLLTFQYGKQILLAQECKDICDYFGLPYKRTVIEFGKIYNQGYDRLQTLYSPKDFHRPLLFPDIKKGFGGTCIHPNAILLKKQIKNKKINNYLKQIIKIGQK